MLSEAERPAAWSGDERTLCSVPAGARACRARCIAFPASHFGFFFFIIQWVKLFHQGRVADVNGSKVFLFLVISHLFLLVSRIYTVSFMEIFFLTPTVQIGG